MLTLNVNEQGANVIIAALRQLPHAQVHDLVMDLFNQVQGQLQQMPKAEAPAQEPAAEEEKVGGTD